MLLTALPLAVWIFRFAAVPRPVPEALPGEVFSPQSTPALERREAGRVLGAGLALLTLPAGAAGLAEARRARHPVSTVFALLLVLGLLACLFLLGGVFFLAMPLPAAEILLYGIARRPDS